MVNKFYCDKCKFFKLYHYTDGTESKQGFCSKPDGYFENCAREKTDWCYEGEKSQKDKELLRVMISGMFK